VTALGRLHVRNLARRNSLESGTTWEKKSKMAEKYKELQQLSESPTISMAMPTCRAAAAA
jgi:hypothetical protein